MKKAGFIKTGLMRKPVLAIFYQQMFSPAIAVCIHSLISAIIVCCLDSIKAILAMSEFSVSYLVSRERSGSVVECLTRDGGAAGSSLIGIIVLCPGARTLILA